MIKLMPSFSIVLLLLLSFSAVAGPKSQQTASSGQEQLNVLEHNFNELEEDYKDAKEEYQKAVENGNQDFLRRANDKFKRLSSELDDLEDETDELKESSDDAIMLDADFLNDDINELQDKVDDIFDESYLDQNQEVFSQAYEAMPLPVKSTRVMPQQKENRVTFVFPEQASIKPQQQYAWQNIRFYAWATAGVIILTSLIIFEIAVLKMEMKRKHKMRTSKLLGRN